MSILFNESESNFDEIHNFLSEDFSHLEYPPSLFLNQKREREKYENELIFCDENQKDKESKEIFDFLQAEEMKQFPEKEEKDEKLISYDIINKPKKIFKEIYPEIHLFEKAEINIDEIIPTYSKYDFSKRRRSKIKLRKYLKKHNILVKMKTAFINTYLLKAYNKKIKEAGYNTLFGKLPHRFVINVSKGLNKVFMQKTLFQILKEEETYAKKEKTKDQISKKKEKDTKEPENTNFNRNLNIVNQIEKGENPELILILNTKICHLFDEYLNSEDFLITEINRLKTKTSKIEKDDYYLAKYIYVSKHLKYFC